MSSCNNSRVVHITVFVHFCRIVVKDTYLKVKSKNVVHLHSYIALTCTGNLISRNNRCYSILLNNMMNYEKKEVHC